MGQERGTDRCGGARHRIAAFMFMVVRRDQRTITVQSEIVSSDESTRILILGGLRYSVP
jgi:hypothetical protein